MTKRGRIILILLSLAVLLAGCTSTIERDSSKINIVVSFYPLAEFAKAVGREKVAVTSLVPPGVEPHEWEPSPSDVVKIASADILIYNGAGLEGWIDKILKIANKKTVIIEASKGIDLIRINGVASDPHVWLDPSLVAKEVENIEAVLSKIDPNGAEFYRFNAVNYISGLNVLDNKFKAGLSECSRREFITSHEAFGYLARRYSLTPISVAGISSEVEPTPKHVAEIVDLIKQKNVKVIFVETLVNPKVSEAIARDAGASVDVLNPFEGLTESEIAQGNNYFTIMGQNLNKLQNALGCK